MPAATKPTLFINHASEDKADFVEPLAEALKTKDFPIWIDKEELRHEAGLLAGVNKGLLHADYGVAVFSKAYFAKKWPMDELEGLYALEDKVKRVIIPVWYGVTVDDVKKVLPMFAGRPAIDGNKGIAHVVSEIELIVGVADRIKSFSPFETMKARLKESEDRVKADNRSRLLLGQAEGARMVLASVKTAFDVIASQVDGFAKELQGWSVVTNLVGHTVVPLIRINGPHFIIGEIEIKDLGYNMATIATLNMRVRQTYKNEDEQIVNNKLYAKTLTPYIYKDAVLWFANGESLDVPVLFLEEVTRRVAEQAVKGRRPSNI